MSGTEYLRLVNEVRSTKGHAIFWQIDSIAVSHGLFLGNHEELARKLNAHSQLSGVAHLYRQDRRQELQAEFREIMRLLHNYVAAVKSLVDHTRRIATKLLDAANLDIYQQQVDTEFKDDPATTFLHDLRNYFLHVSQPPVQSTMRFQQNAFESVGIELSPSELLNSDCWRKPSIEFINAHREGIPLAKLVVDYERKVFRFYTWLIDHLRKSRKSELDEFEAKQQEWASCCRQQGIPTTDAEFREFLKKNHS